MRDVLITNGCHVIWWTWNCSHFKCEIKSRTKNQWEKMLKQTGPFCQNVIGATHYKVEAPNETKDGGLWEFSSQIWPDQGITEPVCGVNLGAQNGLGNNVLEVFYWPRPGGLGGVSIPLTSRNRLHTLVIEFLASSCTWRNSGPAARE